MEEEREREVGGKEEGKWKSKKSRRRGEEEGEEEGTWITKLNMRAPKIMKGPA